LEPPLQVLVCGLAVDIPCRDRLDVQADEPVQAIHMGVKR
jgi:hypothetical protein